MFSLASQRMVLPSTKMIPGVKPKKDKGTCSVCHLVFRLHTKNGLVHEHGLRATPCLGSHQLPWSTRILNSTCSVANESQPNSESDMIDQTQTLDASATQNPSPVRSIQHPNLSRGLLRQSCPQGRKVTGWSPPNQNYGINIVGSCWPRGMASPPRLWGGDF